MTLNFGILPEVRATFKELIANE
jgi:hypothetical protein